MNRQLLILIALTLTVTLSGCATYFERSAQTKCFTKDWSAAGFDTAKRGDLYHSSWRYHDRQCKQYNVWSNQADFVEGYELGLEAFCTQQNGFEFGVRDYDYYPICEPNLQRDFDAAFKDGKRLYLARAHLDSQQAALYDTHEFIEYARDERRYLADAIDSGELDKKTEKKYVKKRYKLKKRKQSAERDLGSRRSNVNHAERQESSLSDRLYNRYYHDETKLESGYSIEQSIASENQVVVGAAIFLYKPNKLVRETRRNFNDKIKMLVSHMVTNHPREFRFQVIRGGEFSFIDMQGREITLNADNRFGQTPTLIFWDTKQLTFQSIDPNVEPPFASLDSLIASQQGAIKSYPPLASAFDAQHKLEERPYRSEAEICRKANHEPGTIGAVECIGPLLVE